MASTFPTSLDSFTDPTATSKLNSPSHYTQHANNNDAIEKLEAKVGLDSSVTTTSHDYKLSGVTSTDKAVSKTGTETLTNKTLTTPTVTLDTTTSVPFYTDHLYRQALINGNFDVWQRGTSLTLATGAAYYGPDRFKFWRGAYKQATTVSQQDGTGVTGSRYSTRVQRDSGNTDTQTIDFIQPIETANAIKLRGSKITISFWAKCGANYSPTSSLLTVKATGGTGSDEEPSAGYTGSAAIISTTVTLTTSWQKFTATSAAVVGATINEISAGVMMTPVGTASTNDWFEIAEVGLCAGDVALPFMPKSFEEELRACQRYFCTSYNYGQTFGTADANGSPTLFAYTIKYLSGYTPFKVKMRITPTVVIYSASTGTIDKVSEFVIGTEIGGTVSTVFTGMEGIGELTDDGTAFTAGLGYRFHFTASAEL